MFFYHFSMLHVSLGRLTQLDNNSLTKAVFNKTVRQQFVSLGGSPGLVVLGGDSCYEGRGLESWHRILD